MVDADQEATPEQRRQLGRRGSVSVVGRVLVLGLLTAQFALAARVLDSDTFGAYAAALAIWTVVGGLAEFGLLNTSIMEFHRSDERHAARASGAASLMLVAAALSAGLLFGLLVLRGDSRLALVLLVPWFVLARLRIVNIARHQYHFRITRVVATEVGARVVLVVLTLSLFAVSDTWSQEMLLLGVTGALAVSELLALVGVLVGHGDSFWPVRDLPWIDGRRMIRKSAPLGLVNASSMVHAKSDQVVLDILGKQSSVAVYAVAYRINDGFLALVNALGAVSFPTFVRSEPSDRARSARFLLAAAGAIGAVGGAAIVAFAPQLMVILGGADYRSGAEIARLLAPAVVVSTMNLIPAQVAIVQDRAKVLLRLSVAFAVANIALNFALVPALGPKGAAVATVVTESFGFLLVLMVARAALPGCAPVSYVLLPVAGFLVAGFGSVRAWEAIGPLLGVAVAATGLAVAGVPLLRNRAMASDFLGASPT